MTPATPKRIVSLDMARSIAIFLAIGLHLLTAAQLDTHMSEGQTLFANLIGRAATPTFILLFGAMLEIVYLPRLKGGGGVDVVRRLMIRSAQCFLLCVVSIAVMVAADEFYFTQAVRAVFFMDLAPYTSILQFYAVVLFVAPVLLLLRRRFGLPALFLFTLIVHAATPLLRDAPYPHSVFGSEHAVRYFSFFYGGGQPAYFIGPSVLHGLTLVVWGQIAGCFILKALRGAAAEDVKTGWRGLGAMTGIAFLVAAAFIDFGDFPGSLRNFADIGTRNANSAPYYAYSTWAALMILLACLYAYDVRGSKIGRSIAFIGKTSLFSFAFGNIAIYHWPFDSWSPASAVALTLLAGAYVYLQSLAFWTLQAADPGRGVSAWRAFVRGFQRFLGLISGALELVLRIPSNLYARALGWTESFSRNQRSSRSI